MKTRLLSIIILLVLTAVVGCARRDEGAVDKANETVLATIDGEPLTQADFELTETWLPDFVRQTDEQTSLNITRFQSMVGMVLMANDARKNNLMSDAETSLVIKEAQAQIWLDNLPLPEIDLSESVLQREIAEHPEKYTKPARYTVNYALLHTESRRRALAAAHGLLSSAQLGYNFMDPPPEPENKNAIPGLPRLSNKNGYSANAKFFNYEFVNTCNEKKDDTGRLGPFSADDELIFSCPKAIAALEKAALGRPIREDISCDDTWKAFVIPEWREPAAMMDDENAKLHARQNIINDVRAQIQAKAIQEIKE